MYFYNNSYVYTGLCQSATGHFLFQTRPTPLCLALCNLRILQAKEFFYIEVPFKIPLYQVLSMKECTFGKSAVFLHFWGVMRPQKASLGVVLYTQRCALTRSILIFSPDANWPNSFLLNRKKQLINLKLHLRVLQGKIFN